MSTYQSHVKPLMADVLKALGMNVHYRRASGNFLYYVDETGAEKKVLDMLGGYGSLIFGHNHPELVATSNTLLESGVPVHAQFSLRERAGELAQRLEAIFRRELRTDDAFNVTYANSGAEAVEVAIKHAELARVKKLQALLEDVTLNIERVQRAIRRHEATIPSSIFTDPVVREYFNEVGSFDDLIVGLVTFNAQQLAKRPIFVALEKSFHGKLIGSVQLTYNGLFRKPFQYFGMKTRFLSGEAGEIARLRQDERTVIFDLGIEAGKVVIIERELPIFSAFLVEPVQGEGGINVLSDALAREIRKACNELDCPLIIDEIQSGMGRSGTFLASTQIPLKGDYYTLSKSLGGGIAKISATVIRKDRYEKEFSLIHSSTFAEDDFSAGIALKVLDMLEAKNGAGYAAIRECSEKLWSMLENLKKEFPTIIKEIRGKGLLLGLEIFPQPDSMSTIIRSADYNGSLGYLLSGYLLKKEGIRISPTGSAPNVLRLEPSCLLTDADIAHLQRGLRNAMTILLCHDAMPIVQALAAPTQAAPREDIRDFSQCFYLAEVQKKKPVTTRPVRKVAFINHLINTKLIEEVDPSLAGMDEAVLRQFIFNMSPNKTSVPYPPVRIHSPLGSAVDFILYPLCATSEQMEKYLVEGDLEPIRKDVEGRIRQAREDGCEIAGLGMYTSIVTNNCMSLKIPDMALTSGNALTVAMGVEAIERGVIDSGKLLEDMTLVVVGAAGNIASTYASLLSQKTTSIRLIGSGREGSLNRLNRTAELIYEDTWNEICTVRADQYGALAKKLGEEAFIHEWLANGMAPAKDLGKIIRQQLNGLYGKDPYIRVAADLAGVKDGDIVLCAANSATPILGGDDFKMGAIVCDIAVPGNVVSDIRKLRPDLVYQQGGIVATPNGESLHPGARAFLKAGELFACMAETVVLGLANMNSHYSWGAISRQQVIEIAALAKMHGFSLSGMKTENSL